MTAPVFSAVTRPAERGGIPYDFIVMVVAAPVFLFILTQGSLAFWGLTSALPLYVAARIVARREPYLPRLAAMKLNLTMPTLSNQFWGGASYGPE